MPIGLKGREWSQERLWDMLTGFAWEGYRKNRPWRNKPLPVREQNPGICSLCHMANVGFGAKPRKWNQGLVPCGVWGQSPCPADIILSMAKTLGKFSRPEPWGRNRTDTTMCPPPSNCWQSLQFYVSKPFSPPETVDTKACPNYQIVAKSEHKVPEKP